MKIEELQALFFFIAVGSLLIWKALHHVITRAGGPPWLALATMCGVATLAVIWYVVRRIKRTGASR
jgi:divalent metal cation (Fe/Co/Zn/Cd) transporter